MKNFRTFALPFALLATGAVTLAPNAMARDQIDWSISIGSPGVYAPPPPVVYTPPPVVYAPPPPVVYTPRPVYPVAAPGVVYRAPAYVYGYPEPRWRGHGRHWHRHWKDRD